MLREVEVVPRADDLSLIIQAGEGAGPGAGIIQRVNKSAIRIPEEAMHQRWIYRIEIVTHDLPEVIDGTGGDDAHSRDLDRGDGAGDTDKRYLHLGVAGVVVTDKVAGIVQTGQESAVSARHIVLGISLAVVEEAVDLIWGREVTADEPGTVNPLRESDRTRSGGKNDRRTEPAVRKSLEALGAVQIG